ncbi:phage integrase N-terminal SAM-like domain-containing protein [Vibrio sp. 10N.286.48.C11]|uniref:phage integrase N-terminal SAM-like domain-containing protein n=1 Tax=Vibrio sp. 10N.286.48.C11 TaxID=3229698 RepID=UPI003557CC83
MQVICEHMTMRGYSRKTIKAYCYWIKYFAYFGAFRSVISGLSDHPFRFKPITDSAIIRSLLA